MKPLLLLGERDCRWPIGRPEWSPGGVQWFCAMRRRPGKPYCEAHCLVAYSGPHPPAAAAANVAQVAEAA
jgi:hypothetical protein